ncbi:hypothetical protein F5887DRAFT_290880 [Amanita rubescens]|nr:hypothetical protein F5887DRAFT_290880 [Amanita rubescens]
MLLLHTLLFFLFGTQASVVVGHPLIVPRTLSPNPVTLHVPKTSHGRYYRLFAPDGKHEPEPVPKDHINDVIEVDDRSSVDLYELPENGPGLPTFIATLKDDDLARLNGRWIFYPKGGQSLKSRRTVISIQLIHERRQRLVSEPTFLSIPPRFEPIQLGEDGSDGSWYLISGATQDPNIIGKIMRLEVRGGQETMRSWLMSSYEKNTGTEELVQNIKEFRGYLLRYLTRSTPLALRSQILQVR